MSVHIHTRPYTENLASYTTAAGADRLQSLLAQARNCSGGLEVSVLSHRIALDKVVEYFTLLYDHLSRSTAGDIAEHPQAADACISRSTPAGVAELPQFAHTCAVAHSCSFIYILLTRL